ncbi:MAG: hypothetical protein AAFO94_09210, partial [Bacteroidota bacterium]
MKNTTRVKQFYWPQRWALRLSLYSVLLLLLIGSAGATVDCEPTLTPVHPLLKDLSDGDELFFECGEGTAFIPEDVMATAGCPECPVGDVKMDDSRVTGDCPEDGYIERMKCWWYVDDECGNRSVWTIYIVTIDTKPPVFTSTPADATIACDGTPVFGTVTAEDACSENVTITSADSSTGDNCDRSYMRTWTAVDECGNEATFTQTITAIDDVPPVFTFVPADREIDCNGDFTQGMAAATDNCGTVDVIFVNQNNFDVCSGGKLVRFFTATDACGNTATARQIITLTADVTPPVFTSIPADKTIACGEDPGFGTATAFDDCSGDAINITNNDIGSANACSGGTLTRVFVATDACGRVATAEQVVTVLPDDTAPEFTFVPPSGTFECGDEALSGNAMASDDCGSVNVSFSDSKDIDPCVGGSFVRTFTATDDCGNATTATQMINQLPDTQVPVFTFVPADKTMGCGADP